MLKWLLHKFDVDVHDLIIFAILFPKVGSGHSRLLSFIFFISFISLFLSDIHVDLY
jgi:hypothetical protein